MHALLIICQEIGGVISFTFAWRRDNKNETPYLAE